LDERDEYHGRSHSFPHEHRVVGYLSNVLAGAAYFRSVVLSPLPSPVLDKKIPPGRFFAFASLFANVLQNLLVEIRNE
jgi:hypothetical protein